MPRFRCLPVAAVLSVSAAVAGSALAAEGAPELKPAPEVSQRNVGMVGRVGVDGAYGGVRVGASRFGVEGTFGYAPVLALESGIEPWWPYNHAHYFSTAQANGELYFFPWKPSPRAQIGLDVHYAYNTLLLNGAGASFRVDFAISRALVGGVRIGGTWFPVGVDQVRKQEPPGTDISGFTTASQGFGSFELVWYP